MTTPNQKADARPIFFMLHNTASDAPPVKLDLVIRPEELTRTEVSRASVNQTLGGAWLDNWGPGVPSVSISGTTGWGQGARRNGQEEFVRLHETIFQRWHAERATALRHGFDPDKVKLLFCDDLDGFTWVAAPMNFVLRRSKTRPLLSQYQINLSWLADGVADRKAAEAAIKALAESTAMKKPAGFLDKVKASLASALSKIKEFAAKIKGAIGAVLGPIQKAVAAITELTATALSFVLDVIATGMSVVTEVTDGLFNIATNLTRAAGNVTSMIQSVLSIPTRIKAEFARVTSAFQNAFCVMKNAFRGRKSLPDYSELCGASLCSSTAGGRPISRFDRENPFPVLLPIEAAKSKVSSAAAQAINRLVGMDPVLAPPPMTQVHADLNTISSGVILA